MNLFDNIETLAATEEFFEVLAVGPAVRIERIVSMGQVTAAGEAYAQGADEWVALLQGRARLEFGDGEVLEMVAGDWVFIEAHRTHRVTATSSAPPCVWLAVHGTLRHPDPNKDA